MDKQQKEAQEPAGSDDWCVVRLDDNGNTFILARGLSREEAQKMVADYERRGHKQTYMSRPQSDGIRLARCLTDEDFSVAIELTRAYLQWLDMDLSFQNVDEELEPSRFSIMYGPPAGVFLLAWQAEELAGGVGLRRLSSEICEMKRLFVHDQFKGLGIGRRLCEKLLDEARALGFHCMRLDTLDRMAPAISLYKSLGFADIEPYCFNPNPTARYMELSL